MADKENLDQLFNLKASFPTKEEEKAFFEAAENNDIRALGKLIDKWPDAPRKWLSGTNPVIVEHSKKMTEKTINYLVQRGADINSFGSDNFWSPLCYAAQSGRLEDIEKLLRCGAEVDAQNKYRQTALHWAAEKGHMACADLLVLCGADPAKALLETKNEDMHAVIHSAQKRRRDFLASLAPAETPPAQGTAGAAASLPDPVPVASDNVIRIMKRIELKKAGKDPSSIDADETPAAAADGKKPWLKRVFRF